MAAREPMSAAPSKTGGGKEKEKNRRDSRSVGADALGGAQGRRSKAGSSECDRVREDEVYHSSGSTKVREQTRRQRARVKKKGIVARTKKRSTRDQGRREDLYDVGFVVGR